MHPNWTVTTSEPYFLILRAPQWKVFVICNTGGKRECRCMESFVVNPNIPLREKIFDSSLRLLRSPFQTSDRFRQRCNVRGISQVQLRCKNKSKAKKKHDAAMMSIKNSRKQHWYIRKFPSIKFCFFVQNHIAYLTKVFQTSDIFRQHG